MATIMEIITGISQAASNIYDGALDRETGEPVKIGLRREEGSPITDKRIMDGFGVNIMGNKLKIFYHSEVSLKEVYQSNFEQKIIDTIGDCASFLKKEYKSITKNTLGLKMVNDPVVKVEHMNRVRSWVTAQCLYEIEGIKAQSNERPEISDKYKKWLSLGGSKSKLSPWYKGAFDK